MSKISDQLVASEQQIIKEFAQELGKVEVKINTNSYFQNFFHIIYLRMQMLGRTIFSGLHYEAKNKFTTTQKQKILGYLRLKVLSTYNKLSEAKKEKFTKYDEFFYKKPFQEINGLREIIMKGKTHIDAAKGSCQQWKKLKSQAKANFLNQAAFQFDKQRYTSIGWGMLFAAIINSTIYKNGSVPRRAALFLTLGHFFGQYSYYLAVDQYFDTVYDIFKEDANQFTLEDSKNQSKRTYLKGTVDE